jgi:hypothetical protein
VTEPVAQYSVQAHVPWRTHALDVTLLGGGCLVVIISFLIDLRAGKPDWFARAGAIAVLAAAIVAYRSLSRHYRKFSNNVARGYAVETSSSQVALDLATLTISVVGTLVWAYGDKWI